MIGHSLSMYKIRGKAKIVWGIPHSASIGELLKAVFSLGSDPRLYNWEGKARYLQSTESQLQLQWSNIGATTTLAATDSARESPHHCRGQRQIKLRGKRPHNRYRWSLLFSNSLLK
jgi:hypothetical protein